MVVKSASKKKLMDLGVSEAAAHILADGRKWDSIKLLTQAEINTLLAPSPGQPIGIGDPIDTYNRIRSIGFNPDNPGLIKNWYWWTPFDVQDLISEMADLMPTPGVGKPERKNRKEYKEKIRSIFIGAPLLHIGYVVRPGIDTPEPRKCPRYQLGIITGVDIPLVGIQGYTIRVDWVKDVVPNSTKGVISQRDPTGKSQIPWLIANQVPDTEWDPNPSPTEWKKENPLWKQGKGAYGPNNLVFTPGHDGGLADAFLVLLAQRPVVDGAKTSQSLSNETQPNVNPSHSRTFTKEKHQETDEPITYPADLREKFGDWDQEGAFDQAIDRIIPHLKGSMSRLAINWQSFDKHIGV